MKSITGRGWSFPPRLNNRQHVLMVQDDEDIKEAIRIILNTAPGERVMHPDFGCNLHELIFWPANHQTAILVQRRVTDALIRWEPRINLVSVEAVPGAADVGQIIIEIEYEIKRTHDKRSMVYPFYLIPA